MPGQPAQRLGQESDSSPETVTESSTSGAYSLRCLRYRDFSGSSSACSSANMESRTFMPRTGSTRSQLRSIRAWCEENSHSERNVSCLKSVTLHKEELQENWARARRREPLNRIAPLE